MRTLTDMILLLLLKMIIPLLVKSGILYKVQNANTLTERTKAKGNYNAYECYLEKKHE